MRTFTVKVKNKDAEVILAVLEKFKANVIEKQKPNKLTLEIAEAIREVKLMREGKIPSLTLEDI